MLNPDDAAFDVVAEYRDLGLCAFVIRATPEGKAYYIGNRLPKAVVRKMLLDAAEEYMRGADEDETLQ